MAAIRCRLSSRELSHPVVKRFLTTVMCFLFLSSRRGLTDRGIFSRHVPSTLTRRVYPDPQRGVTYYFRLPWCVRGAPSSCIFIRKSCPSFCSSSSRVSRAHRFLFESSSFSSLPLALLLSLLRYSSEDRSNDPLMENAKGRKALVAHYLDIIPRNSFLCSCTPLLRSISSAYTSSLFAHSLSGFFSKKGILLVSQRLVVLPRICFRFIRSRFRIYIASFDVSIHRVARKREAATLVESRQISG